MRTFFKFTVASAFLAFAAAHTAQAGESRDCTSEACRILHKGKVHGRLPLACVSIPFIKEGYGQVLLFVLRDFEPNASPEQVQDQLAHALFKYPKITGPVDDFCLSARHFAGGNWVILCDEHHSGWIKGEALQYAIRHGRPRDNRRVHIGTRV